MCRFTLLAAFTLTLLVGCNDSKGTPPATSSASPAIDKLPAGVNIPDAKDGAKTTKDDGKGTKNKGTP